MGGEGDGEVYSMSPSKLVIAGEGGVIATNLDELATKLRMGREYGNDGHYNSVFAGLNARLSEFNALIGQHSLLRIENAARSRNRVANNYRTRLSELPGLSFQEVSIGDRSSYTCFPLVVNPQEFGLARDQLALALAAEKIDTRNNYDPPLLRQTPYQPYVGSNLGNTDFISSHILSLPVWSGMDAEVVAGICLAVERAHEFAAETP